MAEEVEQIPPLDAATPTKFMLGMLGVYVLLIFSRVFEIGTAWGLAALRPMVIVTTVGMLAVVLSGAFARVLRTEIMVLLSSLTVWMLVCLPFSSWRSESLDQFLNQWLKSLVVFIVVVGLGLGMKGFRRAMFAMGWAAALSSALVLPSFLHGTEGNAIDDRLSGTGSLSNANEVAFHFLFGLPFVVWSIGQTDKKLTKIILMLVGILELAMVAKTVSREGLLIATILVFLTFFRLGFAGKVKLAIAVGILAAVGISMLSDAAIQRYITLFSSNVSGEAAASAMESSRTRKQKLQESVDLTVMHPIFGVGMGVFMPASVELAKQQGHKPDWQVSHNSYTQVSSELGFPGIALFLGVFASMFRQLFRVDRLAKAAGRKDMQTSAFCMFLSVVVLAVHFCFDSMAYLFYLPLVGGLATSFVQAAKPLLEAAGAESSESEEPLKPEPAFAGVRSHSPQIAAKAKETKVVSPPIAAPNPFRFGRRRQL